MSAHIQTFQPTRPLRGATAAVMASTVPPVDFNPRAPCGARPMRVLDLTHTIISTHAPLAGRDSDPYNQYVEMWPYFNPRAPCGARLKEPVPMYPYNQFQPTRPLRGATGQNVTFCNEDLFQPTRPLRGATSRAGASQRGYQYFNPRAPCGARLDGLRVRLPWRDFNPRAPCGARRLTIRPMVRIGEFQPTRPLRGATTNMQ